MTIEARLRNMKQMSAGFNIEESEQDGVCILTLQGSLDGHNFVELEKHLERVIGKGQAKIIFNLEDLAFIVSAGVGILINSKQRVGAQGGDVVLVNPTNIVKEVFEVLGLANVFTITKTLDEGLANFAGAGN